MCDTHDNDATREQAVRFVVRGQSSMIASSPLGRVLDGENAILPASPNTCNRLPWWQAITNGLNNHTRIVFHPGAYRRIITSFVKIFGHEFLAQQCTSFSCTWYIYLRVGAPILRDGLSDFLQTSVPNSFPFSPPACLVCWQDCVCCGVRIEGACMSWHCLRLISF